MMWEQMSFIDQQYSPLTRSLRGRILELGTGRRLRSTIDATNAHLTAVDISVANLRLARRHAVLHAGAADAEIDFVAAAGEALPFADASFDAVIGSFVFCSVRDMDRVAAELARVAKPSAALVLIEHVRSGIPAVGAVQDAITPAYARLFRNCHLNRNPLDALRRHGFQTSEVVRRGRVMPWTVFTGTRLTPA
jgi:phosphatidylethanolamine/phosphatidyl-N-methylethanolamine N-methyltransferase